MPSIGPVRLAPFLTAFAADHRDIELTLAEAPLLRLNDLLLGGHLDAAVVAYVNRPDRRFHYSRLYRERIVVVAPKGHRFEQSEVIRLRDLRDENLLFRTNCDMGEFLLESCRKQGFEPRIIHRSAREDWVQTMVGSGFGVTVMPEFTRTDTATLARPLAEPDLVRQLSLVTVAARQQVHPLTTFVCAIRAQCWQREDAPGDREPSGLMSFSHKSLPGPSPSPDVP
jgi:DNA-binding transcriptional LysR family regulator